MPDVELPLVVKKGPLDVGLNNMRPKSAIVVALSFFEDGLDVIEVEAHLDSLASVAVLPWLHDPYIPTAF